jgi:hypothetical protein
VAGVTSCEKYRMARSCFRCSVPIRRIRNGGFIQQRPKSAFIKVRESRQVIAHLLPDRDYRQVVAGDDRT